MKGANCVVVAGFIALLAAAQLSAGVITFEPPDFNLGGNMFLDLRLTHQITVDGVLVTINGGADLRVYDLVKFNAFDPVNNPLGNGYAYAGPQALIDWNWTDPSPTNPTGNTNPNGTDFVFNLPVYNFSLIAGDFGADGDTPIRIEAFDAGGSSLGFTTANWPSSAYPPFALLSLNYTGIRRVHYSSGGVNSGSTFMDNVTFSYQGDEPRVPEPATLAFTALGLASVAVARRIKTGAWTR
jgi:hypothetical protein